MRKVFATAIFFSAFLVLIWDPGAFTDEGSYDPGPPFALTMLSPAKVGLETGEEAAVFSPRNPYNIFINYELGMHCVGFDMSYCCIIPPYNSVQAQAVRSGVGEQKPRLLTPEDGIRLSYAIEDNSYSEGNKMRYWQVLKDVSGNGTMGSPGDNLANYVWNHLFIYKGLSGFIPEKPEEAQRLRIGKQIQVNIDSGPSGKNISGGYLDYAGAKGGNIVFTDSLIPGLKNIPLKLTSSNLWDALGLPLTAFNDSRRKGSIRTVADRDFQPYQHAVVRMEDEKGNSLIAQGKAIQFFGTNPVDISSCALCHSGEGLAANLSRGAGLTLFDKEYVYWKTRYSDTSEYMARLSAASVNVLELHDKKHKTEFLKHYNPDAPSNRLGKVGAVNCADCHGDNMSGNLATPRPGATGYAAVRSMPLTEAVHSVHARSIRMPDKAGRTQSCQICHPVHWQNEQMNNFRTNPFAIADEKGDPRFSQADLRVSGGGCYLRRDAHSNPSASPPFFLNDIGRWYLNEVSLKDENGKKAAGLRGLYCTNCHNHLTHELYRYDNLTDAVMQQGKTLRNRPIRDVMGAVAGGDAKRFREFFADPVTGAPGEPLYYFYRGHKSPPLARAVPEKDGTFKVLPWNADKGETVPYSAASAGNDWWLAPGIPHCANCHASPFVESEGGKYFPMDQPAKYSLYRYSKAHGALACQTCHESMHGLYPVRYEGPKATVDLTSHEQALQFSPDGKYAGPVTCAACHTVNKKGIPVQLKGTAYYADYWASVVLIHFMREGDEKVTVAHLVTKYPYKRAREIVAKGWK